MKKFLALFPVLLLSLCCFGASAEAEWLTDLAAAETAAKQEHKPILMLFTGSDWCPPCMRMEKQVFPSAEFQKFARENLILLKLDFPSRRQQPIELIQQNRALRAKYEVRAFPTCILVSPEGKVLCNILGGQSADQLILQLKKAAKAGK